MSVKAVAKKKTDTFAAKRDAQAKQGAAAPAQGNQAKPNAAQPKSPGRTMCFRGMAVVYNSREEKPQKDTATSYTSLNFVPVAPMRSKASSISLEMLRATVHPRGETPWRPPTSEVSMRMPCTAWYYTTGLRPTRDR